MYYLKNFKKLSILLCFSFLFIFSVVIGMKKTSYAITLKCFSYDKIYKALPEQYRSDTYVYQQNDIAYIRFAKVGDSNYTTSVKKKASGNDYFYCVDYSKHVAFDKSYAAYNKLFGDNLRSRIGLALFYGAGSWDSLAHSEFTTGNSILDYYMTQVVIHSLIYEFGGDKSSYGVEFSKFVFYSNTTELQKKTKLLYNFCCNATITASGANFQNPEFSFITPSNKTMTLNNGILTSGDIHCKVDADEAPVESYSYTVDSTIDSSLITVIPESQTYDSPFHVEINADNLSALTPGSYSLRVSEEVAYKSYIAGFWKCSDSELSSTAQEIGGLIRNSQKRSDLTGFRFLIGSVTLHKTDSVTGDIITDAAFDLLQYDDNTGSYVPYKSLTYNPDTQLYESGNIFINSSNSNAMFMIVESAAGANYVNDWEGQTFQLTDDVYTYEFNVENQPILGKLQIVKKGENPTFTKDGFSFQSETLLENVQFSLYAEQDVVVKGNTIYKASDKIMDLTTDAQGCAYVNDLPPGKYYVKECSTGEIYVLDSTTHSFTIEKNSNNEYSQVNLDLSNKCKQCKINVFKYYSDDETEASSKKIPLKNAKFGLYAAKDIYNSSGECIVSKDTLLKEGITDENGNLVFDKLMYADYYIRELEAPEGFLINEDIINVSKKDFDAVKDGVYSAYKECKDQKKLFQFNLVKYGEACNIVSRENTDNGDYCAYSVSDSPLSNVQFSFYNSNDELICQCVTDEKGTVRISNLEAGEYYYIEDSAPGEYLFSKEKTSFVIQNSDYETLLEDNLKKEENIEVQNPVTGYSLQPILYAEAHNQMFTTHIAIQKLGEAAAVNDDGLTYSSVPMEGVVFGIYQNFDYTVSSDNVVPQNTCVGYLVTDSEGNASFDGKIPSGQYYFKEIKTNKNYILDEQLYYFDVTPSNDNFVVTMDNGNIFTNELAKSSVKIIKVDSDTNKPLKNVEFTLYNEQGNTIGVYKTNRKGIIQVDNLPYGNYYFVETKCRNGYYSTNNKFHFTLDSEQMVVLNITNQPILKLGFSEHYKIALILACIGIVIFVMILMFQHTHSLKSVDDVYSEYADYDDYDNYVDYDDYDE